MLNVAGLARRFGDVVALDGVTFSVPDGALVGFVGRNGAGKTTAMRVIMGMVAPDAGDVAWRGAPVDRAARLRFGYMPEERGLYPKMGVAEQLVYFARMSGLDRRTAERQTDRWTEQLGLDERRDDPVDELSLGNQQRVQLGAALVHQPQLLILDEPFSGLDPVGVDVLSDALKREARRGAGVLFSSHQLDLVERLCDDVVMIDQGRVVTDAGDGLRDNGEVRVEIEVAGAHADWADHLDGATVLEREHDRVLLEVAAAEHVDGILRQAQAAGSVRLFQVGTRSLADRFREAVDR